LLSFFVDDMRENLHLPAALNGKAWLYHAPTTSNTKHHHAELELNLVTRGSGTYLLANRKCLIRPGDLLWLFPAQEHLLVDYTEDFEMWIAVFRHKLVKRAAIDPSESILLEDDPADICCRRLAQPDLGRLEGLFAELAASSEDHPSILNAGLSYALLQAWRSFDRAADVAVCDVHPAVERAARLIRSGSTELSLDELAHQSGLSAPRLSRLFKEQIGLAMVSFRNRLRVQRYLEIYGTGQRKTMLDAALEAGFGSYPQFHRVFKSELGCSPASYRYERPFKPA
jgi:AraC-like DNA-binding protein